MKTIKEVYIEVGEEAGLDEFEGSYINKANKEVPFKIRSMTGCYLHYGARYPIPVSVPLGDDAAPLKPGLYDIDPLSFFAVGQRGRVELGRDWKLTPRLTGSAPAKSA